ncbi:MAG: SpoIID/LytB domain-containing protein [Chloroflexota bacterium]
MPPRPIAGHTPRPAALSLALALGGALLIALIGGLGGAPRAVLGADPVASTAASATPSPTSAPTATPAPSATPTPTPGVIQLGATVRFFGRGYGHGVGMSQYGARGRALAGQTSTTILAHYYRGATLGTIPTTSRIRVRVLYAWRATSTAPLLVYGRRTTWTVDGIATVFPFDAALRLIPTATVTPTGPRTSWRLRVTAVDGTVLHDAAKPTSVVLRGAAGGTRFQLWSKPGTYDQYRGLLRIRASSSASTVTVVDDLPLESYLRGVVPAEMPSAWPAAALRSQAIASRSYAARRLRPGVSYYDVVDTSASQVYLGALGERASTNRIIAGTAGVVLKSGSTIANTLFHSTGGGATESNQNVFTSSTGAKVAGALSYLRGSSDRTADGTAFDAAAPYATWSTRTYTAAQVSAWLAADPRTDVGALTALDLRNRGVSGRLISVTLIGSGGTRTVSGEIFRSVFNTGRPSADPMLRSTLIATAPIP